MSTACDYRLKVALLLECKHCYASNKLLCFKKTVMRGPYACVFNEKVKTLKLLHIPPTLAPCFYMKTSTDTISNCNSIMMYII